MGFLLSIAFGFVCAAFASSRGRSSVGWFFLGFFFWWFFLAPVILLAVLPDLKIEQQRWGDTRAQQNQLQERLRQERQRREAFENHALSRLDTHDRHAGIDTRATAPPALPSQLASEAASWYYEAGGTSCGPIPPSELREKLASGQLTQATLVWREGMADWAPAGRVGAIA